MYLRPPHQTVLPKQLFDWREFRSYQVQIRARYGEKKMSRYTDHVAELRQSYGLCGRTTMRWDLSQQTTKEGWIEFQSYHMRKGRGMLESARKLEQQLAKALAGPEQSHLDPAILEANTEYARRIVRAHAVLLSWIEQRRGDMQQDVTHSKPAEVEDDIVGTLRGIPRLRKACPHQRRRSKTLQTKRRTRDLQSRTMNQIREPTSCKQGLQPHQPDRVTKRESDRLRPQSRSEKSLRTRDAPSLRTTRCGRISRPPQRWVPE